MRRTYWEDGRPDDFEFYFRKKEKPLVRNAYRVIDEAYWDINTAWEQLQKTCQSKQALGSACWIALEDGMQTTSEVRGICNINDPDSKGEYDNDFEFRDDIYTLHHTFLELHHNAAFWVCKKKLLMSTRQRPDATPLSKDERRFLNAVVKIHLQVLDRALALCQSTFETFCQLFKGDTLFIQVARELKKLEVTK